MILNLILLETSRIQSTAGGASSNTAVRLLPFCVCRVASPAVNLLIGLLGFNIIFSESVEEKVIFFVPPLWCAFKPLEGGITP
jgi:hypothetical protein